MGHALVAHFLDNTDPVHKISVISRGQALGYDLAAERGQVPHDSRRALRHDGDDAGRPRRGGDRLQRSHHRASNDLEKVTATAKQMVMRFGMSDKLGPRVFGHDHGQPFLGREFSSEPDYSDEIAREIDDEIRRIVEEAHQTARQVLEEHRESLDMTSEILLKRETIEREQFIELLAGKTEDEVFGTDEPPVPVLPPSAPEAPENASRSARPSRCPGPASPAAPPRCAAATPRPSPSRRRGQPPQQPRARSAAPRPSRSASRVVAGSRRPHRQALEQLGGDLIEMTCPHAAGSAVGVDATIRGVEHVEIDVHVDARRQHRLDRLQQRPGARERLGRHVRDPRLRRARALVLVEVAGAREHDRPWEPALRRAGLRASRLRQAHAVEVAEHRRRRVRVDAGSASRPSHRPLRSGCPTG